MDTEATTRKLIEEMGGTPGLVWRKKAKGSTPYWRPPAWYAPDGVKPEHVNLSNLIDDPAALAAKCRSLQADALAWKAGVRDHVGSFDGTLGQIIQKYLADPDSTFFALRPGSRHPYKHYAGHLAHELGDVRIDEVTGIHLKRWHDEWSRGGENLAASKMRRAVLDAAISFAIMSSRPGSAELRAATELRSVLKTANRKIPNPKRRESTVTADDVVLLRRAAHEGGRPSMALAYALVFETTLRLWDVLGQWWPHDAPLVSDVIAPVARARKVPHKWFGLQWEDIDTDLVLRYMPSKTSAKTGLAVTFPLARAPMVMEELLHWPADKRTGPVIVYEGTGLPYSGNYFGEFWRKDREAAGLPSTVWARDLRASGITEGRAAGVSTDDAAKVAGHASTKTTSAIYDRAALEASERFADARAAKRKVK